MKGILFNIVEDVVTERLGEAAWDELLDNTGPERGYTALGNYSDAEMLALVKVASRTLELSERQTLLWLGEHAVPHFAARYPYYFKARHSTQKFLPSLNQVIHPEVRKLYREARPPSFDCVAISETYMEVIYTSHRPLCGLAEGLMVGVANYYGESLSIQHSECVNRHESRCKFDLRFA